MIIGNFKKDAETDGYLGNIVTLTFLAGNVYFVPNEKKGEREPDYRITASTSLGDVEFGAAWKRTSERGQDFLSVLIDDLSLPGPLNAALFLDEDGESAALVWNRRKIKPEASVADAPEKVRPAPKKAKAA